MRYPQLCLLLAAGCGASLSSPPDDDPDPGPVSQAPDGAPATTPPGTQARDAAMAVTPRDGGAPATTDSAAPPAGPGPDAAPAMADAQPGARVFNVDVLHEIAIEVAATDLAALDKSTDAYVPCKFVFDGIEAPMSGIRRKGLTTRSVPLSGKPSFSINIDTFVANQNVDGLHKIILNSAHDDPGFVNEHLGYTVLRSLGLPAALSAHAIVTFNGAVKGVYVVKESVDKQFLARVYGRPNRTGNLYEGSVGMGYTGDFVLDPTKIELKDEKEEMRLRDDVIALAAAIRPDSKAGTTDTRSDDQFTAEVSAKLQLKDAITTYAANALLSSWDSYWWGSNNYYIFDNPIDGKFVFVSHGMDRLFAKLGTFGAGPPLATMCPLASSDNYNGGMPGELAKRIRKRPALNKQFVAEVARLVPIAWDVAKLNAIVDRVGTTLHATKRTDAAVVRDLAAYDANRTTLRDFFVKRRAFLDMVAATGACPAAM
jgi:hypothetical protein